VRPNASPAPATALLPAGATATRPAPTGGLLPSGGEQLSGEVTSFAASARVLLLRAGAGVEQQVSLTPDVVVRRSGGGTATTADLRPGSRVQVSGRRGADGTLVADQVTVLSTP
jgi:hypothetical protein